MIACVHIIDKSLHRKQADFLAKFRGFSKSYKLPFVDDANAMAQCLCFLDVVRGEKNRDALKSEASYQFPYAPPRLNIQAHGWLIKKEDTGFMH